MAQKDSLSIEQTAAALAFDSPVCILAGAGSGKTRVITHRIAHLVRERGVQAYNVLGVTFTNKAAREMRMRVERLLPSSGRDVVLGTFHGLAARFLRYHGELVSVDRDFLIYDEDDASRLIKKIIKENYDLDKEDLASLAKKVLRMREGEGSDALVGDERALQVVRAYRDRLARMGALDFSSLLSKFLELLKSDAGMSLMSERIRHLVVDEYQDINDVQASIVHLLANRADSVAIVGDDDQSIYGWRGASARYMQDFLNAFHDAKLFRMVDNYRSTKPIVDCANAVIENNSERLGKELRSVSGDGPPIRLSRHFRDSQEAMSVVEKALHLFESHGPSFEVAVLMRTNAQSRPLEEALHKARVPYRMVGGMRFYDRKEIKDILAALRAVIYQHSDIDVLRMLDALPLGIGRKTQDALSEYAGRHSLSLLETMGDDAHQYSALGNSRSRKRIESLLSMIREMRAEMISVLSDGEVRIMRADEALIYAIDRFGFAKRLEEKNDDEAESRLENIEQLVQAAVSFVEESEALGQESDVQSFLENVALISKDESVTEDTASTGTITLMTLHAAKGLEFDGVFLIGLEETILPHARALHGFDEEKRRAALEEERRLLYVGITRARSRLYLSFCQERFLHGKTSYSAPSRFLKEIPSETIDERDRWLLSQMGLPPSLSSSKPVHLSEIKSKVQKPPYPDLNYRIEYDAEQSRPSPSLCAGDKVYHASYHHGTVIDLSGQGRMVRVKVRFDGDGQIRTIMSTHLHRA